MTAAQTLHEADERITYAIRRLDAMSADIRYLSEVLTENQCVIRVMRAAVDDGYRKSELRQAKKTGRRRV